MRRCKEHCTSECLRSEVIEKLLTMYVPEEASRSLIAFTLLVLARGPTANFCISFRVHISIVEEEQSSQSKRLTYEDKSPPELRRDLDSCFLQSQLVQLRVLPRRHSRLRAQ